MNATEVLSRVSEAKTLRELPDLVRDLVDVDPRLLFDTLFPISIKQQGEANGPVAVSAYVIHALNPPCPITPSSAVSQMLQCEWDISIEEVPWYLANQFGADEMQKCVADALHVQTDESARTRLESVRYWVDLNPNKA